MLFKGVVYLTVAIFTVSNVSYAGPPAAAVGQSSEKGLISKGERRSFLCRVLLGPRQPKSTHPQLSPSTLLEHADLKGGGVPYEVVEALEFKTSFLSSSWFFDRLTEHLKNRGLIAPAIKTENGSETVTNTSEVLKSLELLPFLIDRDGRAIAESIFRRLRTVLHLDRGGLGATDFARISKDLNMSVQQTQDLREFVMSNLYREDDIIDAIHLSLGKGAIIVREKITQPIYWIRTEPLGAIITGIATATPMAVFFAKIVNYISEYSALKRLFPEAEIQLGSTYYASVGRISWDDGGRPWQLQGPSGEVLESGVSGPMLSELHQLGTVGLPYISAGAAVMGIALAGFYFPKFYRNSELYIKVIRERMLKQYRAFVASQNSVISRLHQAENRRIEAAAEDAIVIADIPHASKIEFAQPSDIQALTERVQVSSEAPQGTDIMGEVRSLGRELSYINSSIVAAFTQDIVHWRDIFQYYNQKMTEAFDSENRGGEKLSTLIQVYKGRLSDLNSRILAYDQISKEIKQKIRGIIQNLQTLKNDEQQLQNIAGNFVEDGKKLDRLKNEIDDAINRLTFLLEQTVETQILTLDLSFEKIREDNNDLEALEGHLQQANLRTAVGTQVRDQVQSILVQLIGRKVDNITDIEEN